MVISSQLPRLLGDSKHALDMTNDSLEQLAGYMKMSLQLMRCQHKFMSSNHQEFVLKCLMQSVAITHITSLSYADHSRHAWPTNKAEAL